jgi:3-(3-hydroxy-phenyl)propionate hydroxylase
MAAPGKHYQVVIVGAGPTGLMLANLLGDAGIKTLVLERYASTVSEPRAVSIDDEALRTTQAAGLADEVIANVMLDYGSHYFSAKGQVFAKVEPSTREYGYPRRNAFRQPLLEATLRDGLDRFKNADICFQHTLTGFSQSENTVNLNVQVDDGDARTFSCDYLAACDGGRSFVRTNLAIGFAGSSFEQRWLIIDLNDTKDTFRHTRVFSNPERPGISLPGPHNTRRFEFMLRDGETTEQAETERFARDLMEAHGPDGDAEIVRRQVYTFHARRADRWQDGRIFLLGDAAHLTPPFAGQGMNSGIRDAHNLAWKLAAVLKGELSPSLLATYEQERKPHAWALIELALTIGRVMVPKSPAQANLMQAFLKTLSLCPPAKRYVSEMRFKPKPYYREGFISKPGDTIGKTYIGRMFPQPRVELPDGQFRLLDEVLGNRFAVLALCGESTRLDTIFDMVPKNIACICVRQTHSPKHHKNGSLTVRDIDGLLRQHTPSTRIAAFIVRPDRYIADAFYAKNHSQITSKLTELLGYGQR